MDMENSMEQSPITPSSFLNLSPPSTTSTESRASPSMYTNYPSSLLPHNHNHSNYISLNTHHFLPCS